MIAVLLLAFGCPDSTESIEPFITNVMGGRKPSPNQLQKIKERYLMIGGRSPLLDIKNSGAERIVAVVMAPHYSKLSTGNYIKAVNEAMAELTPPTPPFLRGREGEIGRA